MTTEQRKHPQREEPATIPIGRPLGFLRSLLAETVNPSTGERKRAPLASIGRGAERASLYAMVLLAIQIALNVYGIPTPITFNVGQINQAEETQSKAKPPSTNAEAISPITPTIAKATISTQTGNDNGGELAQATKGLPDRVEPVDFSDRIEVPEKKKRVIGGRIADTLDALKKFRK